MPTHTKLTETILTKVHVADGREETHWDGEMRGLGVRVRQFGGMHSRTWIIKYRNAAGAQRKLTLGDWPGLSVKAAKSRARKEFGRIADKQDPARDRAKSREAGTVAGLLSRFLKEHVKVKRQETTSKEYERLIEKVIKPGMGNAEVQAVERADVERWFTKLSDTPRQANQALAVLSKAMNLAEGWRLRSSNSNPCRGVERYPEVQRDRHPAPKEYAAIGKALSSLEDEGKISSDSANVIKLLALTGFRLSEVRKLKWGNIDLKAGMIRLDRTKNGKLISKSRAVGTATVAILANLKGKDASDDAWVFPATSSEECISIDVVENAWKKIRSLTKTVDLRIHDLRHGVGTIAANVGGNAFQVRDKLGHVTLQMTNRYVSKQDDPLKALSEKIESQVSSSMAGKTAKIVSMNDARKSQRV